jgi:hypothetical protein
MYVLPDIYSFIRILLTSAVYFRLGKPEQTSDEPAIYEVSIHIVKGKYERCLWQCFCLQMMCDSSSFAVDLLNELARAFTAAADTRSQVI